MAKQTLNKVRSSMKVVLDLIENSDYIYSRKAFDKCPLPVAISSTENSAVEYVNVRYSQRFGSPDSPYTVGGLPTEALRINRTVGRHNISIFLPEEQTQFGPDGDIHVDDTENLASWLDSIMKPTTSADLKARTLNLQSVVESFKGVVDPLLENSAAALVSH